MQNEVRADHAKLVLGEIGQLTYLPTKDLIKDMFCKQDWRICANNLTIGKIKYLLPIFQKV